MVKTAIAGLVALAAIAVAVGESHAATRVGGSVRSNGTYVMPHVRSNSDGRAFNNYSTRGNVNPYTGRTGTRSPASNGSRSFGSARR